MMQTEIALTPTNSAISMLRDYYRMALRRKWILLTIIFLSVAAAFLYCKIATKIYRSDALILLEDQKVPEILVQGIEGKTNFERRIFVIETQVRDHSRLEKIRTELNLFPALVVESGEEAAIGLMNSAIEVMPVGKGTTPGQNNIGAFSVSFAHQDPATAMKVTARIVDMLIDEDLKDRTQTAEGATEFLDNEVARTKLLLDKKEEEISRFKSQHVGQLPQAAETNFRTLDRLHGELNVVRENLQRQTDRLGLVNHALQQYVQFGVTIPTLVNGPAQANPAFTRLNDLKAKLAQLQSEFWEGYPEVMLTKEEISQLEQKLRSQYNVTKEQSEEQAKDPYYQDLKKQLAEIKNERALLLERQRMLLAEKTAYDRLVETAPAVEQELLTLMRDYDNLKSSYHSLVEKRLHALVAENLEKRQKGAQLKVLEKAKFPRAPERPNQPRVMFFGLLLGCGVGLGIVIILEQSNPQFRRPEDIEQMFGPQLLAVIPHFNLDFAYGNWKRFFPTVSFGRGGGATDGSLIPTPEATAAWGGTATVSPQPSFIVRWFPNAIASEQYRVAATRLAPLATSGRASVVAVSSALPGEGKTTTVINLGYTMARDLGKRVLLLDCDMKCPGLDKFMENSTVGGLADYLAGTLDLDDCVSSFGDVSCWVMPVGNAVGNSTEVLRTDRLAALFDRLRMRFDYIILNTPPILPQATMNVLEGHADVLLLVVRANSTPHDVVRRAVGSLRSRKSLHVVLNAVGSHSLPSYVYEYGPPRAKTPRGQLRA
ncbi:MAG: AAA family ATPase [Nitrospira sp.]|nr:AAA family ATPase [Nitrospira sp.]